MGIFSEKANLEIAHGFAPDDGQENATYGEVFDASIVHSLTEGLSVSRWLDPLGLEDYREEQTRALFDSGELDRKRYTDQAGKVNYDEINKVNQNILTDEQIKERRNENLARTRADFADIKRRDHNVTAEFLGGTVGFMLDPVNIATMGISAPFMAVKGLTTIGNALRVGRNVSALTAGSELLIQPLVFDFKQEIDSPYSANEAIAAVAMAAAGGFVLGGVTGGIGGYLSTFRKQAINQAVPEGVHIDDLKAAMTDIQAVEDILTGAPKIDIEETRAQINRAADDYQQFRQKEAEDYQKSKDVELMQISKEAESITKGAETLMQYIAKKGGLNKKAFGSQINLDPADIKYKGKVFGKPLWRTNGGLMPDDLVDILNSHPYFAGRNLDMPEGLDIALKVSKHEDEIIDFDALGRLQDLERREMDITQRVDSVERFKSDILEEEELIELIEQKIKSKDEFEKSIKEHNHVEQVKSDVAYLETLEKHSANKDEEFNLTDVDIKERGLDDANYDADFAKTMEDFDKLESPKMLVNDELTDAKEVMKGLDDDMQALEGIRVCAIE